MIKRYTNLRLLYFTLPSQEIGQEERVRTDLCRVGRKTLTQSIDSCVRNALRGDVTFSVERQ